MKKFLDIILDILAMALLVVADQVTKYLTVIHLKDQDPVILIQNVLQFRYLENRGAAFGMLQNKKLLFIFIALIMLTAIFYVLIKLPRQKKYFIWHIFLCLIAAGGVGNMIDRITQDYVTPYYCLLIFYSSRKNQTCHF